MDYGDEEQNAIKAVPCEAEVEAGIDSARYAYYFTVVEYRGGNEDGDDNPK